MSSELLELYKIHVEMADRVSQRRHTANQFYLTSCAAILTAGGFLNNLVDESAVGLLLAVSGIFLTFIWGRGIKTYKDLNNIKFELIQDIEKKLEYDAYTREWGLINDKNKKYRGFSSIEGWNPIVFRVIFLFLLLISTNFLIR